MQLTEKLDVAYELLEVRTGDGLRPIYRTGTAPEGTPEALRREIDDVLSKAFGQDGTEKRRNVERLKGEFTRAWEEESFARRNLDDFARFAGL